MEWIVVVIFIVGYFIDKRLKKIDELLFNIYKIISMSDKQRHKYNLSVDDPELYADMMVTELMSKERK